MDVLRKLALVCALVISPLALAGQSVDLNTADKATLMNIKGVGESRAEAIIAYREIDETALKEI